MGERFRSPVQPERLHEEYMTWLLPQSAAKKKWPTLSQAHIVRNIRLWAGTFLCWLGVGIVPKDSVLIPHCEMLALFHSQIGMGRTFGVVTVCWAFDPERTKIARMMELEGIEAIEKARAALTEDFA